MSKSLFISRSLTESSPILDISKRLKLTMTDRSLIDLTRLDFDLPSTGWLFFYSKSGVQFFFDQYARAAPGPIYKIACFGPATGLFCNKYQPVDLVFDANAKEAAMLLARNLPKERITFVCGKKSLRSVQKYLTFESYDEVIVYDHEPSKNVTIEQYDIAILTSPMNVRSFVDNGGKATRYIAIGNTTASTLKSLGINCLVSEDPTELSLVKTLRLLLED